MAALSYAVSTCALSPKRCGAAFASSTVHLNRFVLLSFIAVKVNVSLKVPGRVMAEDKSLVSVAVAFRSEGNWIFFS